MGIHCPYCSQTNAFIWPWDAVDEYGHWLIYCENCHNTLFVMEGEYGRELMKIEDPDRKSLPGSFEDMNDVPDEVSIIPDEDLDMFCNGEWKL